MKRYRLKKDLPDLKAGAVFVWKPAGAHTSGYWYEEGMLVINDRTFYKFPRELPLRSDWFEPIPEEGCEHEVSGRIIRDNKLVSYCERCNEEIKVEGPSDRQVLSEWLFEAHKVWLRSKGVIIEETDVEPYTWIKNLAQALLDAGLDVSKLRGRECPPKSDSRDKGTK